MPLWVVRTILPARITKNTNSNISRVKFMYDLIEDLRRAKLTAFITWTRFLLFCVAAGKKALKIGIANFNFTPYF
jgi:hypothetical protein